MRDFKFTEQERPTMANFNARFDAIAALANGLGNEYVWAKYEKVVQYKIYTTNKTTSFTLLNATTYSFSKTLKISNNQVVLADPTSVTWNSSTGNSYCQKGWYLSYNGSIYDMAGIGRSLVGGGDSLTNVRLVSWRTEELRGDFIGYVNSPDPSAYPPSVSDGYTYMALGQLANLGVKIATGSYTGTGTYGSRNPNSLTFDFEPKLVFISGTSVHIMLNLLEKTENSFKDLAVGFQNGNTVYTVSRSHSGNTVYWYASNVTTQINNSGSEFNYIAIG